MRQVSASTSIDTLSLPDALPISGRFIDHAGHTRLVVDQGPVGERALQPRRELGHDLIERPNREVPVELESRRHLEEDRKSTRLNSSHLGISYAVFCLKKKSHNVL